ncbi:hypothetical protein MP228_001938 [Amoeboaphelidium protococcarum]|nr:hypothetical protein MP228_001938 [Amoeboaphelidium protococcarum]
MQQALRIVTRKCGYMIQFPKSFDVAVQAYIKERGDNAKLKEIREDVERWRNAFNSQHQSIDIVSQSAQSKQLPSSPVLKYKAVKKQVLEYGPREVVAYLASRLPSSYALHRRVLQELKDLDSQFTPQSVIDFGCGPGVGLMSTRDVWSNHKCNVLDEYYGIDVSQQMLDAAEYFGQLPPLIVHDNSSDSEHSSTTKLRLERYISLSDPKKYNLAICANLLTELPSDNSRRMTLDALWQKTGKYLVVIEHGSAEGFRIVNAARDYLLNRYGPNAEGELSESCSVIAPCPHSQKCPISSKQTDDSPGVCRFKQRNGMSQLLINLKKSKSNFEDWNYSYFIMRKNERVTLDNTEQQGCMNDGHSIDLDHSRILGKKLRQSGLVELEVCAPSGQLETIQLSKRDDGKDLFKLARKSIPGQRWINNRQQTVPNDGTTEVQAQSQNAEKLQNQNDVLSQ